MQKIVLVIRSADKERAEQVIKGSVLFRSKRGYAGKKDLMGFRINIAGQRSALLFLNCIQEHS